MISVRKTLTLPAQSHTNPVDRLKAIALQTGSGLSKQKENLLKEITAKKHFSTRELRVCHDTLLAMLAYPGSPGLFNSAVTALKRITSEVKIIFKGADQRRQSALDGSGIEGSEITGSFSLHIARWLAGNFPEDAEIESSGAGPETVRLFFRQLLPRTEFENISAGELSLLKRIKTLKGTAGGSPLQWLLREMDNAGLPDRTGEALFHELNIFIKWKLNHPHYNRSWQRDLDIPLYCHKKIIRNAAMGLLRKKLPSPARLSASARTELIHIARSAMVYGYRETEPFTYADENELTRFELERGMSIVLYGMNPERRLSVESYIGYLAFKNGIPVAYGGGWLFGRRCQFGINILSPFRGGESALLFYQLLRVYAQHFGARRFVVKPYQFGRNNREALQSGAFWFYYKAGFRPEEPALQRVAAAEWKKKKASPGYRTPLVLLKRFTDSHLRFDLEKISRDLPDAAALSALITSFINDRYKGDRGRAWLDSMRKTRIELGLRSLTGWSAAQKKALGEWSLLAAAALRPDRWKKPDKAALVRLIRAKGRGDERVFIHLLQRHRAFWNDLRRSMQE